jgi:glycosyltransferase involved in cell wall biosynthesis
VIRSLQEALIGFRAVRLALGLFFLGRGGLYALFGAQYRAMGDFCWVVRVGNVWPLRDIARGLVFRQIHAFRQAGSNTLRESYLRDRASADCAALFSLTGKGPHDLFRDLIVLKQASDNEKGVILLKYVRTFDAVSAMFDLPRLMGRYIFVLEPCWAGYWDPSLLMYFAPGQPVFVQCFTRDDLAFVTDVGAPFVPVPLGPADWVNADLFEPPADVAKTYDVVMVANWAPHKRHAVLFDALEKIQDRAIRVLLIGFPLGAYSADTIRRAAAAIRNPRVTVEVVDKVPAQEVARYVAQCKVFVFLSKKEGDNKALVEAMFADVPAIVYDRTIGGASSRVNPSTAVFSSDADLAATIVHMLDHYTEFAPRAWALAHTGSAISSRRLNETIGRVIRESGGAYTRGLVEKTNSPNLAYRDPAVRSLFEADYRFILQCWRGETSPVVASRPADAAARAS